MNKIDEKWPLVSVADLATRLHDPEWIIVDCRFNLMQPDAGREGYKAGHIPGAFYADLDKDLASPATASGGGRHPLPPVNEFRRLLHGWGIEPTRKIVVYDDAGGAIAARLWWLIRWMGHRDVALLDGGLSAWLAAGRPLSADTGAVTASSPAGENLDPGHMPTVAAAELEAGLADDSLLLLDARAPERFSGTHEPLDAIAGHVPGAKNLPFQENLGPDDCFRPASELRERYLSFIGGRAASELVCMCGSGVTACHTLLALEIAGIEGAALYVGSWSDWISSADRPVATD